MAKRAKRARRPGLPRRSSIVQTRMLTRAPGPAAAVGVDAPKYKILRTNEVDAYDAPLASAEIPTLGAASVAGLGDAFKGKARKAAKISIVSAQTESFNDLKKLIASLVPDDDMANHEPPIKKTQTSGRVKEEKRNVRVRAFIYAASRESDNDFHIIIGRDPNASEVMFMNVELSGLPPQSSTHFARLKAVRKVYKDFFSADLPGETYDFYDPPIPVEVEGSLFFDINHATGSKPGPSSLVDDIPTVWEIHPITGLTLEP